MCKQRSTDAVPLPAASHPIVHIYVNDVTRCRHSGRAAAEPLWGGEQTETNKKWWVIIINFFLKREKADLPKGDEGSKQGSVFKSWTRKKGWRLVCLSDSVFHLALFYPHWCLFQYFIMSSEYIYGVWNNNWHIELHFLDRNCFFYSFLAFSL